MKLKEGIHVTTGYNLLSNVQKLHVTITNKDSFTSSTPFVSSLLKFNYLRPVTRFQCSGLANYEVSASLGWGEVLGEVWGGGVFP